ncbi:hypothetical protein ACFWFX_29970 [Streptomyces roseolus]|uniref:hypothetical protein n=1 Tax=Streptomyces roseolus TaxID=67358 RepID=UPI003650D772
MPRDAPVTVVGGGLTDIERATEPAEQGRAVTLVCGRTLAPAFSTAGRRSLHTWLLRNHVAVLQGVSVNEVRRDAVALDDGSADLLSGYERWLNHMRDGKDNRALGLTSPAIDPHQVPSRGRAEAPTPTPPPRQGSEPTPTSRSVRGSQSTRA